eukprot:152981_1
MRASFWLFCLFNFQLISSTIHSTTLLPSNSNTDGIEVILNENNENVMVTSSIAGSDLHISMNNSWKFLSDKESIFTFKVYSESITDFLFIISQNTQKYLSSIIEIS